MKQERVITNIREYAARVLPSGANIILFGSQARGDSNDRSDWDLLILLDHKGSVDIAERGEYIMPIYMLGAELGIDINPVIYTQSDWHKRSFTPFYKNVIRDGICIWG